MTANSLGRGAGVSGFERSGNPETLQRSGNPETLHSLSPLCYSWAMFRNTLYCGDNLDVMREFIPDESVDLAYLDPPFNSARDYNVLFKQAKRDENQAQITAFRFPATGARKPTSS